PAALVGEQEGTFDRFLGSVKFKGDEPVWDAPEGWRPEGQTQFRFATFRSGPLELRVSRLPNVAAAADVLQNVNRWRGQVNLPPLTAAELKEQAREVKIDGIAGTRVDMTGTRGAGGMGRTPPFAGGPRPGPAAGPAPFKYTTPEGWEDLGPRV